MGNPNLDEKFLNVLADAYRLQEAIISATELAIISTDIYGIVTSFNYAAEQLLGYKADDIIGRCTPELFHDPQEVIAFSKHLRDQHKLRDKHGFKAIVALADELDQADRREWTYIARNGTRIPVIVSMTALRDDQKKLMGYAGIASDITEQKINDERIRKSEAGLQALVTSLTDLVFELDEKGRYMNVWSHGDELLAMPKEQFIGRSVLEVFGEEFGRPFEEGRKHVIETGESFVREYQLPGNPAWYLARYALIYDNGNPSKRVSVNIEDITKRKLIELSLRQSEEKFRILAENMPGVVYLCNNDDQYSFIYLTSNVEALTGYTRDEFLNGEIDFVRLYHPEDKEYIFNLVENSIKDKVSFHLEYRIKHKVTGWCWIEETGIGVYQNNELLFIEGFMMDITERKVAEDELRRMADENIRVFNHSLTLQTVTNFDGMPMKLNAAWEKNLGWSVDDLKLVSITHHVHPEDHLKIDEYFKLLSSGANLPPFECRFQHHNGAYRWLLWSATPDLRRKLIYVTALDITDRKRSEEELIRSKNHFEVVARELEEQNNQLDEFAHIISHNLRSPVGNIKALIGFLQPESTLEEYKLIFEKIKAVTGNLGETMNELMETLRIKKNTDLEKTELQFQDILTRVKQSLEGEIMAGKATIVSDFSSAPSLVYPKTYLESILQNLVSNAIKYRSPQREPRIEIRTQVRNGHTVLMVTDNGQGIDLERHGSKLFGLHKTFHEHAEARGVGLFLTRTQIEAMGGTIRAESKVDVGTKFIITF